MKNNYIYPFLWMRGEVLEAVYKELDAIQNANIGGVCLESRTYEAFCQDAWWTDLGAILTECRKRNMKVWLLDDKHFPTGYANGILEGAPQQFLRHEITELHMDISGPMKQGVVITEGWCGKEEQLLAVLLCERNLENGMLTGKVEDVTSRIEDGLIYLDLDNGIYRLVFLILTRNAVEDRRRWYIDPLDEDSVELFIKAVYEPHWEHFSEFFGTTFECFFSDEPGLGYRSGEYTEFGKSYELFPWTRLMWKELEKEYGENPLLLLPGLWFEYADQRSAKARIGYMNAVTRLYQKHFSRKIGNWCKEHCVSYAGHTIEDNNVHTMLGCSTGHYFRGIDGQDYAGIDVVLNQLVPGLDKVDYAYPGRAKKDLDYRFFHFVLAKLGVSSACLQEEKLGRTVCEIFGANGWAEGSKMMKWLSDHMLVRGVNYFIPHAFSIAYPATHPPHFYAQGNNPQYEGFGELMKYMNRACELRNKSKIMISAAILYHAEAEWSGYGFDRINEIAEIMASHQVDYIFLPADCLCSGKCEKEGLLIGSQVIPRLLIPFSECLPLYILEQLSEIRNCGIPVYFLDKLPVFSPEIGSLECWLDEHRAFEVILKSQLANLMKEQWKLPVCTVEENPDIRILNFRKHACDMFFISNENIHKLHRVKLQFDNHRNENAMIIDLLEQTQRQVTAENGILETEILPYHMLTIVWGEYEDLPEDYIVRRHIVGGGNRSLNSLLLPP